MANLDDVLTFVQVGQIASIGGAARSLDVPNSAVSQRLSVLEARLGVSLVRRRPIPPLRFALQLGRSTFGVFDAFLDQAGRPAHLNGPIA